MSRAILVFCLLFPLSTVRAADEVEPIRLKLTPASDPKSPLKYRLLPQRRDTEPGNAATHYYRAFAMFVENRYLLTDMGGDHWERWKAMPLSELPLAEVRDKVRSFRNLIREVEHGTKRRECDWMLENRSEGIGLLLPELQGYRSLARILLVRTRLEMVEGKWDEAVRTLAIGFGLGKHLAQGPSGIHFLVGAAITQVMAAGLEEMVQQPGSPNLYWALSVLPKPFLDPTIAIDQEIVMIENMCPWLKKLENGPLTTLQIRALEQEIDKTIDSFQIRKQTYGQAFQRSLILTATYPEAKKYLLEHGLPSETAESLPVFQAVALFAFRDYHESAEEACKWLSISDGVSQSGFETSSQRWKAATERLDQLFFRGLLTGLGDHGFLQRLTMVNKRVDRRFAALRVIEALRMYAAAHDGKLPSSLAAVKEVPIPLDPASGKAFLYELNGDRAFLSGPDVKIKKGVKMDGLIYELTMKK